MSEGNIENITKSDSNFAPIFVDHYVLPYIIFNGLYSINNIYIPKKVINTYICYKLHGKKFKHRFDIKELLIWICKAN